MERAVVKNAADPQQVGNAENVIKRTRGRELEDLRWVLSDSRGRRFLFRLMAICKVEETPYQPGMSPNDLYFMCGTQNVGKQIKAEIVEARENALIEMMRENRMENERTEENGG